MAEGDITRIGEVTPQGIKTPNGIVWIPGGFSFTDGPLAGINVSENFLRKGFDTTPRDIDGNPIPHQESTPSDSQRFRRPQRPNSGAA